MYLRRVRVVGRSFAAALAHLYTAVMPPASAAENLGVALGVRRRYLIMVPRPLPAVAAGEEQLGSFATEQSKYHRLYLYSGKVTLAAMYLRVGAPRSICIAFGGRIVRVGAPRFIAGILLKTHKLSFNFRICGAYRRALRRINHPALNNRIYVQSKRCERAGSVDASTLQLPLPFLLRGMALLLLSLMALAPPNVKKLLWGRTSSCQ
jgi:hypothetical protein